MSGLHADLQLRRGDFVLDVEIDVPAGGTLALLGPNGSGKSTVLALVAGLLVPDRGTVTWRGRVLTQGQKVLVTPASRRIGLLGQEPLLFPHLTVAENVAFGARAQRANQPRQQAAAWLQRLEVAHLADRRPRQLSGGQAARVALARALAAKPEVLLLDEPFAALDASAAPQLRQVLTDVLAELSLTTVLVSHDVLDAALVAEHVTVLHDGRIVEQGSRAEVLSAPRTPFAAALTGVNLVPMGFGGLVSAQPSGPGQHLRFRPSAVVIDSDGRENAWDATVRWLEPIPGGVRVRLATAGQPDVLAELDVAAVDPGRLRPGAPVRASVPAEAITVV